MSQLARGHTFCLFSELWARCDTQGEAHMARPGSGWMNSVLGLDLLTSGPSISPNPPHSHPSLRESRGCALSFPAVLCVIESSRIQAESSIAERTLHNQPVCRPTRCKCMVMYWQHSRPQAFPDAGGLGEGPTWGWRGQDRRS